MNKSLFAIVGIVLVLTACGAPSPRVYKPFGVQISNIVSVSVDVINDKYIVVSQEPIYVRQSDDNAIYWNLDSTQPYYFPDTPQNRGIDFQQPHPTDLRCGLDSGNRYTFVCTYKRAPKNKYPYTIKVTKDGNNIVKSDPTVMND